MADQDEHIFSQKHFTGRHFSQQNFDGSVLRLYPVLRSNIYFYLAHTLLSVRFSLLKLGIRQKFHSAKSAPLGKLRLQTLKEYQFARII